MKHFELEVFWKEHETDENFWEVRCGRKLVFLDKKLLYTRPEDGPITNRCLWRLVLDNRTEVTHEATH